jgi:hypothetical protein
MGRFLMYATIALLAVFVLSSFTLLKHGNEGLGQVKTYSAHDLPLNPAYDGASVTVDGELIYNNDLDVYELTDDSAIAPTAITGLSDGELEPFAGKRVRINGEFIYSSSDPHLEAHAIRLLDQPVPSPTPAAS